MSADTDAANAAIAQAALDPLSASIDGQNVTGRSADDMLKLRDATAAPAAAQKAGFGIMFRKIVPPGAG